MSELFSKLRKFNEDTNGLTNETDLQGKFEELAKTFLYGGYIQVGDDYKVYIRTVEFYFHSEKDGGVHDPIVYHRNGRDLAEAPYFPIMTLHAHASGFDITFEKKGEYRASALIRSYEVKDKDGKILVWNKEKKMFDVPDNKECNTQKKEYNTQSTYLYAFLNGFSLGDSNVIKWIDYQRTQLQDITKRARQNVFRSESEYEYKKIKGDKCTREWSFTREDNV